MTRADAPAEKQASAREEAALKLRIEKQALKTDNAASKAKVEFLETFKSPSKHPMSVVSVDGMY